MGTFDPMTDTEKLERKREQHRIRQAKWRSANPDRARQIWSKYAHSAHGTATVLLKYARRRAAAAGLPFDLDRDFVAEKLAVGVCEMTGLPLERISPVGQNIHAFAPSLDRIIPEGGYVKGNVRMVCFAVNRARSDWGDETLFQIARALTEKAAP